jgi:adenylate cyclase class 2
VLEQEMKIPVTSCESLRRRLAERGARMLHPQATEDNWVLDDPPRTLAASGQLLRLRRFAGRSVVTFKGAASFAAGIKSRPEYETTVEDADAVRAIFAALGFAPIRRYQKRREIWSLDEVTVALDETPMGPFVELEGPAARLASVAAALALDPRAAARGTYLDLWAAYRAAHPDAPDDMVFQDERDAAR